MELKLCPFCGGEADLWSRYGRNGFFAFCQCAVCSSSAKAFFIGRDRPDDWGESLAAIRAQEAWNRRCSDARQDD